MSKINQQTLITYLQEVVPMMQDSSDPEGTLLKYAHDKNLPPSVMERLGHTFNSLKINSALDMAKTASDRGQFVSTLDVPSLLEKYTDLAKDIDFDAISKKSASNWWDDIGMGETVAIKTASAGIKSGNINDLCWKEDVPVAQEEPLTKVASEVMGESKKDEESLDSNALQEYYDKFAKEAQMCMDYIQSATMEKNKIVKKFASLYGAYNASGYPEFDKLEHGCVLNYEGKDKDMFKESIDVLVEDIKNSTSYADMHIKRASEDLYKKYVIAKRPELMDDVVRYHELRIEANTAMAMYKEASEKADEANKAIFKVAAPVDTLINDLNAVRSIPLQAEQAKANWYKSRTETPEEIAARAQKAINEANIKAQQYINMLSQAEKDRAAEDAAAADKLKKEYIADLEARSRGLETAYNIARGLGSAAVNVPMGLVEGAVVPTKKMMDLAEKASISPNIKEDIIKSDIDKVKSDTILQEIMWTDPILSKLDENSIDNVLETYDSIMKVSPELAFNKGALRSILRRAVEAQGIDTASLKALGDIQKNIQYKE